MTIATSILAGCGNQKAIQPTQQAASGGAEVVKAEEGKVLNIRTWNEEFKSRMKSHYPGYEEVNATTGKIGDVQVNWIIVPSDDNAYQNALDEALLAQSSAAADDKVDLFLIEADYALKYVNTEYTLDVINDLGITQEQLADQYQYTKDVVTDANGNLKGVSWQACPGSMIYRRDIAKEVFGTDDPETIQSYFKDWDQFLESAATLKDAGYKVTASANDTSRVFSNNVTSKWVENGKINIDDNIMRWIEMSKIMVDEGYTTTYGMWSADWSKGFTQAGDVFSYFGPAWFLDFVLGGHDLDGQWATTVGPQGFFWGGTWISGAAGADNPTLVKSIMETLTANTDVMVNIVREDNDFANNMSAMTALAMDTSFGNTVLGGQNPLGMYCEGAETIDLSYLSAYDSGCIAELQSAMGDYFDGNNSLEEALDVFYRNVQITYPELSR
jgi:hypothetical protein